ncbi:hypothetical protein [Olsenella uli]|uniref:hypothetical protein n=1 Tax=Olsenella uli TaxID=133926 RepID=UPI0028E1BA53|nr:hypothetical protein [Olsenella uli]
MKHSGGWLAIPPRRFMSCLENEAVSWPRKWAVRDGVSVIDSLDEVIARTREP